MTSSDLRTEGIVSWCRFTPDRQSEVLRKAPLDYGVIVVRKTTPESRLRGESDIIFVGTAANDKGIRQRINEFFSPGPSQTTHHRVLALIQDSGEYEIGWCVLRTKVEAAPLKRRLLERFFQEHGELPPQNLRW